MRIDKYICESSGLTRTGAKKALKSGKVTCDCYVITKADFKVPEGATVTLDGVLIKPRGTRYIMLNKPIDTVCSTISESGYPSVLSLLDVDKATSMVIAGRLDVDTTGLVLVTDDGQWAHRITSPNKQCGKRYRVNLTDALPNDHKAVITQFANGIQLRSESSITKPAILEVLTPNEVLLTLFEGKYHQVKRMFGALGNKVVGLHREQVGGITLDTSLKPGQWRHLTAEEIMMPS